MAPSTTARATVRQDDPAEAPRWYIVDAEGRTLGRLSTVVAHHLMGKQRPGYAPHRLFSDHVVVVNAAKVVVTGRKRTQKIYHWHSGYPGGLKALPLGKALSERPERVVEWAVQGMLPKNRIGKRMIRNLMVYAGPGHPHDAQRPEPLETASARKSA